MITKLLFSNTVKKSLIVFAFFISSTSAFSQNEFITTWETTVDGESITIPTFVGETYDYTVDWGDGSANDTNVTGDATHNYASLGSHTITITGTFPRISFGVPKIISIEQWGTTVWTSMEQAFFGASNLVGNATDAPDLSGVTNMSYMFSYANNFNQDISSWNTAAVTDMSFMFYRNPAFNNGGNPLSWNTSAVTDMSFMFSRALAFNQDIGSWDTSEVINMYSMFDGWSGVSAFNNGGEPLNWNTVKVTDMALMFRLTAFNQDIGAWNTSSVTDMGAMFSYATIFNQDIGAWNTSEVTDMGNMFNGATAFNQDISAWDTSEVINMSYMFESADNFNNGGQPLNWNTTSLIGIIGMFKGAKVFNQDISGWDFSNIGGGNNGTANTNVMFFGATAYNNGGQPLIMNIDLWEAQQMFGNATNFNQPISFLSTNNLWVSAVMFEGATAFNQDISAWDTSKLKFMFAMFKDATAFNNGGQPLNWNTVSAERMVSVFENAIAFDQNIGGWNVEKVEFFDSMFSGATLSDANYDALLIGWNTQNLNYGKDFDGGNSKYCSPEAQAARANMVATYPGDGWTITDGGLFTGTCGQLGIEDNELDSILLYPNPTKGNITITLTTPVSYSLVSMLGQEIQRGLFTFGDNTLDISSFANGLYFLNVKTSQGTATKKIIKQ